MLEEESDGVVTEVFESYQKRVFTLFHEYKHLKQAYEEKHKLCEFYKKNEENFKKEIQTLLENINSCQNKLSYDLDIQVNNNELKKELNEAKTVEKSLKEEIVKLENKKADEKSQFNNIKSSMQEQIEELKAKVEEKERMLATSQENMQRLRDSLKMEFINYKAEWENKFASFQQNMESELLETYKKKLFHEKQQSEKEKTSLRNQIEQLEQKIKQSSSRNKNNWK